VEVFDFQHNGTTVYLIDTPGFDDTFRTDSDVLKDIAFWLNAAYQAKLELSGIVYLHPIDKNRMTGSAHKNLRMFQELCGDSSLGSVVLATTMWANVKLSDGESRENQLKTTREFWGGMIEHGSHAFRHTDDEQSAMSIISYILDQRTTMILQIQRQMMDEGKDLDETSAGQELERELIKVRKAFEQRLKVAHEEMEQALAAGNKRLIQELSEQQDRFQKKYDDSMKESNDLKLGMEKLLRQKDEEYQRAMAELMLERQKSEQTTAQVSKEIDELRQKIKENDDQVDLGRRRDLDEMHTVNMRLARQNIESQAALQHHIFQEALAKQKLENQTVLQEALAKQKIETQNVLQEALAKQNLESQTALQQALAKQNSESQPALQQALAKQNSESQNALQQALVKQNIQNQVALQIQVSQAPPPYSAPAASRPQSATPGFSNSFRQSAGRTAGTGTAVLAASLALAACCVM
jgi:hypothetical protein